MEILGGLLFVLYLLKIAFHFNLLFDNKILSQIDVNKSSFIDRLLPPSRRQIYLWIFYSSIMFPVLSKYPKNRKVYKTLSNIIVASFYIVFLIMLNLY